MQGVEEIRVRLRTPIEGWCAWTEKEVLKPLGKIGGVGVFEVEAPSAGAERFKDEETESETPFTLVREVLLPGR